LPLTIGYGEGADVYMHKDNNCMHCTKDQRLQDLMVEVCELKVSTLYLFKDQTYKGRCLLSFKGHKSELFELTKDELHMYAEDLAQAAAAVQQVFQPDKINYGAYSDKLPHLHFHIVPKYEGSFSWGGTFEMMPNKVILSEKEYSDIVQMLTDNL
jgi:diadenosine tetraphosphate (Ap4A) HIT family hydrolase